jgi:hypothetical protein
LGNCECSASSLSNAETGQVAVTADDPVAGHDDRDRIAAIRGADRAYGFRPADTFGDIRIRRRLSVWDLLQRLEHAELELGTIELQREIEVPAFAGEVFGQLLARRRERLLVVDPVVVRIPPHRAFREADECKCFVVAGKQQFADRRGQVAVVHNINLRSPVSNSITIMRRTPATGASLLKASRVRQA